MTAATPAKNASSTVPLSAARARYGADTRLAMFGRVLAGAQQSRSCVGAKQHQRFFAARYAQPPARAAAHRHGPRAPRDRMRALTAAGHATGLPPARRMRCCGCAEPRTALATPTQCLARELCSPGSLARVILSDVMRRQRRDVRKHGPQLIGTHHRCLSASVHARQAFGLAFCLFVVILILNAAGIVFRWRFVATGSAALGRQSVASPAPTGDTRPAPFSSTHTHQHCFP